MVIILYSRTAKGPEKNFIRDSIGLVTFASIAQVAKFVKILSFGGMSPYGFLLEAKMQPQFTLLLNMLAGWMNRHQQMAIEYLMEENKVLKELHGDKRLHFTNEQRKRLARKGRKLGLNGLRKVATLTNEQSYTNPSPTCVTLFSNQMCSLIIERHSAINGTGEQSQNGASQDAQQQGDEQ